MWRRSGRLVVEIGEREANAFRKAGDFDDLGLAGEGGIERVELPEAEFHGRGAGAGGEEAESGDLEFREGFNGPAHHDVDDGGADRFLLAVEESEEGLGGESRIWRERGRRRSLLFLFFLIFFFLEERDLNVGMAVERGGGEGGRGEEEGDIEISGG